MRCLARLRPLFSGNALRAFATYAVVAVLSTALFFFLHHVGNRIPLDLAKHRFAHAFELGNWDDGVARGFKTYFTYCQIASSILADAAKKHGSLLSAAQQRSYKLEDDYCKGVEAVIAGAEPDERKLKTRHLWGNKALYAIALRFWSVPTIQDILRTATYIAYVALAVVLLAFAPRRTLLVTFPLVLLGALFSGIPYLADAENGIPYLWAMLTATMLAVLVGRPGRRQASLGCVRIYCFLAGCVSSWVWLCDGHAFLAMTYIGLLVYFGFGDREAVERARMAAACLLLYVTGFGTCYVLGQLVKMTVIDDVWPNIAGAMSVRLERTMEGSRVLNVGELLRNFYGLALGRKIPQHYVVEIANYSMLLTMAGSTAFAAIHAYKRQRALFADVGFILGLMLVNIPQFTIADDFPFRPARFLFVPCGLWLSCLVLIMRTRAKATPGCAASG